MENPEWYGDDCGARFEAHVPSGGSHFDTNRAFRPLDPADWCLELNRIGEFPREPGGHPIVAIHDAGHALLGGVIARTPAIGESPGTDPGDIRGVKALYEQPRELALACVRAPAWMVVEKLLERPIALAPTRKLAHHTVQPIPEVLEFRQAFSLSMRLPSLAAHFEGGKPIFTNDLGDLGRRTVDELRSQLDRDRQIRLAVSEYSSADPVARLEHAHSHTAFGEHPRGSEAGRARADDDDICGDGHAPRERKGRTANSRVTRTGVPFPAGSPARRR